MSIVNSTVLVATLTPLTVHQGKKMAAWAAISNPAELTQPRQEPGKNFGGTVVTKADPEMAVWLPHFHSYTVSPRPAMAPVEVKGIKLTVSVSIPEPMP
jgi:hypothetical protein